jgi:hypothetical protein
MQEWVQRDNLLPHVNGDAAARQGGYAEPPHSFCKSEL